MSDALSFVFWPLLVTCIYDSLLPCFGRIALKYRVFMLPELSDGTFSQL